MAIKKNQLRGYLGWLLGVEVLPGGHKKAEWDWSVGWEGVCVQSSFKVEGKTCCWALVGMPNRACVPLDFWQSRSLSHSILVVSTYSRGQKTANLEVHQTEYHQCHAAGSDQVSRELWQVWPKESQDRPRSVQGGHEHRHPFMAQSGVQFSEYLC